MARLVPLITLALLAHAFLTVVQTESVLGGETQLSGGTVADLIPLTVPEVRRLLVHLLWQTVLPEEHLLRWSRWRRKHQQRARHCHYKRRLALYQDNLQL